MRLRPFRGISAPRSGSVAPWESAKAKTKGQVSTPPMGMKNCDENENKMK